MKISELRTQVEHLNQINAEYKKRLSNCDAHKYDDILSDFCTHGFNPDQHDEDLNYGYTEMKNQRPKYEKNYLFELCSIIESILILFL